MASATTDPIAIDPSTSPPRPHSRRRRVLRIARRLLLWLFVGLLINIAVALGIAGYADPTTGALASASAVSGDDTWVVSRFETRGSTVIVSSFQYGGRAGQSWSSSQVLGPPNTPSVGDIGTAWAQSTPDGQEEWLELTYAQAVVPRSVKVYETYNQGGLTKVIAYKADTGQPVTAWEGTDPSPLSSTVIGISEVPLAVDFPVKRIRIVIDSVRVAGWNEIDAVGLVDRAGNVQWAMKVRASSVYGQGAPSAWNAVPGTGPEALLPKWGNLHQEPEEPATHIIGAYGWPLPSLWGSWSGPANLAAAMTPANVTTGTLTGPVVITGRTITGFTPAAAAPAAPPQLPARIATPYHPVWPGLAVNSVIFAIPVALLHLLFLTVPRFLVEVSRVRSGACIRCGYDLQYDFVHGCSECGWRREHNGVARLTEATTETRRHGGQLPISNGEPKEPVQSGISRSRGPE